MDAKHKNLSATYNSGTLLRPESDALLAVIDHILNEYPGMSKGTFIMQAQRSINSVSFDEPASVIRFNLANGEQRKFLGGVKGSDEIASDTIKDAGTYARSTVYGAVRTGLKCPNWMDVETTSGRFIAVFCAEGGYDDITNKLYLAIAKALSLICEDDVVLQNYINTTFNLVNEGSESAKEIAKEVEEIFETNKYPAIDAWKKWRESQSADSLRKKFFS